MKLQHSVRYDAPVEEVYAMLTDPLTTGTVTDLDPRLAADGVQEALAVMFGGCPPWASFTPGEGVVRVDLIDTDHHVWVQMGHVNGTDPEGEESYVDEPDIAVVDDPGEEPDVVVAGPAGAVDAWLWHRADDTEIRVAGDRDVHERFLAILDQPIN